MRCNWLTKYSGYVLIDRQLAIEANNNAIHYFNTHTEKYRKGVARTKEEKSESIWTWIPFKGFPSKFEAWEGRTGSDRWLTLQGMFPECFDDDCDDETDRLERPIEILRNLIETTKEDWISVDSNLAKFINEWRTPNEN